MNALLLTYIPTLAALATVALGALIMDIPVGMSTRDMAAIAGVHPLTGVISNVGILLWSTAASICVFAALATRRLGVTADSGFLLASGALTTVLLLDDLFMFHEQLAPDYLGITELVVVAVYIALTAVYGIYYRAIILRTEFLLLGSALIFFTISVIADLLESRGWSYLIIEDGAKLLGIANWCCYYFRSSLQLLAPQRHE